MIQSKLIGLKEVQKLIEDEQIDHYEQLLFQANDCREAGISWLIKRLWVLGQEVSVRILPNYLDKKAIKYLFKVKSCLKLTLCFNSLQGWSLSKKSCRNRSRS